MSIHCKVKWRITTIIWRTMVRVKTQPHILYVYLSIYRHKHTQYVMSLSNPSSLNIWASEAFLHIFPARVSTLSWPTNHKLWVWVTQFPGPTSFTPWVVEVYQHEKPRQEKSKSVMGYQETLFNENCGGGQFGIVHLQKTCAYTGTGSIDKEEVARQEILCILVQHYTVSLPPTWLTGCRNVNPEKLRAIRLGRPQCSTPSPGLGLEAQWGFVFLSPKTSDIVSIGFSCLFFQRKTPWGERYVNWGQASFELVFATDYQS